MDGNRSEVSNVSEVFDISDITEVASSSNVSGVTEVSDVTDISNATAVSEYMNIEAELTNPRRSNELRLIHIIFLVIYLLVNKLNIMSTRNKIFIFLLCAIQLALIWPIYPLFSGIHPMILGLPFSFVWVIAILIAAFLLIFWYHLTNPGSESQNAGGRP